MRWLILLLLFSCGKNSVHEYLDLNDDDGDNISNFLESDQYFSNKIANISASKKLKGILKFSAGTDNFEIPFSNETDLNSEALKLLTLSSLSPNYKQFFSEWMYLNLSDIKINKKFLLEEYILKLSFENIDGLDADILFTTDDTPQKQVELSKNTFIHLSGEELNNLLFNKSHLKIRLKDNKYENVRSKTYRVFFFDGKTTKVYYVSKDFTFNQFLKNFEIFDYKNISDLDLHSLRSGSNEFKNWWIKDLGRETKVIAFVSEQGIKNAFELNFNNMTSDLIRDNGKFISRPIKIATEKGAVVRLKFSGTKWRRTFNYVMRLGNDSCYYEDISISPRQVMTLNSEDILKQVVLISPYGNSIQELPELIILQKTPDVFEIQFMAMSDKVELLLNNLHESSYSQTGIISRICGGNRTPRDAPFLNPEEKFSLKVEAFVENFY